MKGSNTMARSKKESNTTILKEDKVVIPKQETIIEVPKEKLKKKEQRDLNELICVRNNTHRKLVYSSKIYAGNEFEWENFHDDNYLELRDLVAMRNSYPTYFKECWVVVDDDILEYLNVKRFYESAIDMENFDSIFNKSPLELKTLLEKLPSSMKTSVSQRAKQLVDDGTIDSMKIIKVLNDALNVDLSM